MAKYVLDIETTVVFADKGTNPSPYLPENSIVSVQVLPVGGGEGDVEYLWFNHRDVETNIVQSTQRLQHILDNATLIIGHNLKFDMSWLYECGFSYSGALHDTMLFEYVISKGTKPPLSLKACAERYGLDAKTDTMAKYLSEKVNVNEMPAEELKEYGIQDVLTTQQLYLKQREQYKEREDVQYMYPAIKLTQEALEVLIDIERAGIKVDEVELDRVEEEFRQEKARLEAKMNKIVRTVMGDTPVNLASTDDLSKIVYGIAPKHKPTWKETFNIGTEERGAVKKKRYPRRFSPAELREVIRTNATQVYRTDMQFCHLCEGTGKYFRKKKDGSNWSKQSICPECGGKGAKYIPNGIKAGLRVTPLKSEHATTSGFSTSKDVIEELLEYGKLSDRARDFLSALLKVNAIDSYLSSFVGGIRKSIIAGYGHPNFNQAVTATGRLSSSSPNWQNMPRGNTFPIRKVVVSRFDGGKILNIDFSQLEYRTAVMLARCEAGRDSILLKKDRHQMTAEVIFGIKKEDVTEEAWKEYRQNAKQNCVPMHSQALTRSGWKYYDEIEIGENILAYDQHNDVNVWTPVLEKIKHTSVPVYKIYHKHNFTVECTKDHRWYGKKRDYKGRMHDVVFDIDSMTTHHQITTSAPHKNIDYLDITPEEAGLLGFLWTDGSVRASELTGVTSQAGGRRQAIYGCLLQKKKVGVDYIERILDTTGMDYTKSHHGDNGTWKYNLRSPELRALYKRAGLDIKNPDKIRFVLSLSDAARREFLNACTIAEGTIRKYGQIRIAQNVGAMKEAIHLAAYLSGFDVRVSITSKDKVKMANYDHATLNLRTRRHVTCMRLSVDSIGDKDVWCPRTKYGTWVMRQGEVITITGNTFRPLYSGVGTTSEEQAYAREFFNEHTGIALWHTQLEEEALETKEIRTPFGRIYAFPDCTRLSTGKVKYKTQISNYPVQGTATADIIWVVLGELYKHLRNKKSKMILQVHDSVTIDVHPEEYEDVVGIVHKVFGDTNQLLTTRYNYDTFVPIGYDVSVGDNLMQQKELK